MPERKCRFTALLLAYSICACALQDAPVAPTATEKAVLERALSDIVALNGTCLTAKIGPETEKSNVWPSPLSLGDGKLSYVDDPRYDQAASAWAKAKPLHANSLEMPDQAVRQGFRVLEDAQADASCREIRTLHTPRFDGDCFRNDLCALEKGHPWPLRRSDISIPSEPLGEIRLRRHQWRTYHLGNGSKAAHETVWPDAYGQSDQY